ncbi:MAG: SocA family protein [Deltaproteobacteria bacterium]|nr:SocA family protein [Deltaproteobacteria bacterium]
MMNQTKFENLVLSICAKVPPEHLTTIKLNKLLWLIDKEVFCHTGSSVTGIEYLRKMDGPVPKDNQDLFKDMAAKGLLRIETKQIYDKGANRPRRRRKSNYHGLCAPDMAVFSSTEQQLAEHVLTTHGHKSLDQLVNIAHDIVWATFDDNEVIPLEAYLSHSRSDNSDAIRRRIQNTEVYYRERELSYD